MHDPLKKRAHAGKSVSHENENNDGNKNAFGPRKSQSNGERPVLVCECSAALPERSEAEIILDHLYEVFGRAVFLVIPRGSKKPANGGWQKTTFEQTQSGEYRAALLEAIRRGGNLGLLLGPASDNLMSIDIDDDEMVGMFVGDNSALATTVRTRGKRGCNFWLRPLPGTAYPNGQAVYPLKTAEGNDYGEFRVGGADKGAQTVIFGIHPEGNRYQLSDGQVAQIDFAQIKWLGPWTKAEPPPKEAEHTGTPDFKKRIASYMAKVPVSVAGEHGDDQLWRAALLLVCGWGLSQTEALPYLRSFNARCLPSWPEARLVYKLKEADEKGTGVRGRLRDDQESPGEEEKFFNELLGKYRNALLTSAQLESAPIVPRQKLLGEWFYEADFGFIYGFRGCGKTWFVDALAVHLSTGTNLDTWSVPSLVPVFYIDGEMPQDQTRDRLKGMAADNQNLTILHHEWLFNQSGLSMNLANPVIQQVLTAICIEKGIKVLILDNLSCLVSGVKENVAEDWEQLLPWLLELRRRRVAVLIVAHAGVSGRMRGNTKREDPATWSIKIAELPSNNPDDEGARFEMSFDKLSRNTQKPEWIRYWHFKTEANGEVSIGCEEISFDLKVLTLIEAGMHGQKEIAEELRVNRVTVHRAVKRLEKQKEVKIDKGKYYSIRFGKNMEP